MTRRLIPLFLVTLLAVVLIFGCDDRGTGIVRNDVRSLTGTGVDPSSFSDIPFAPAFKAGALLCAMACGFR